MQLLSQIPTIVLTSLCLIGCFSTVNNLKADTGKLSEQKCIPCQGGVPPLKGADLIAFQQQLQDEWIIIDEHHLEREFHFDDFVAGLSFTNAVANLAEENQHHPKIILTYSKVKILLWTHKSNGLTQSDFILAAKIDTLPCPVSLDDLTED